MFLFAHIPSRIFVQDSVSRGVITSRGRGAKYCCLSACRYLCVSVCLSASISQNPHVATSRNSL